MTCKPTISRDRIRTLGASVDEKSAILNKILWDIDEFLDLVRHYGGEIDGAPGRIELRWEWRGVKGWWNSWSIIECELSNVSDISSEEAR